MLERDDGELKIPDVVSGTASKTIDRFGSHDGRRPTSDSVFQLEQRTFTMAAYISSEPLREKEESAEQQQQQSSASAISTSTHGAVDKTSALPLHRRSISFLDQNVDTTKCWTLMIYACFMTGFTSSVSFTVRCCGDMCIRTFANVAGMLHLVRVSNWWGGSVGSGSRPQLCASPNTDISIREARSASSL